MDTEMALHTLQDAFSILVVRYVDQIPGATAAWPSVAFFMQRTLKFSLHLPTSENAHYRHKLAVAHIPMHIHGFSFFTCWLIVRRSRPRHYRCLEDRITHGGQVPSNRTPIEVYTDGSKINDQTGSAFCVIANEAITKTWKAKLSPANTVFQAEMLALKAAIEWANTENEDVNIWSGSESSLQALKSFNVKSKIIQEAQMTLLENARIRLGWVKAHIGIKGNEIALAKEATTDGIPASLPFPKSFLKKQLLQFSLSRWQAEWDNDSKEEFPLMKSNSPGTDALHELRVLVDEPGLPQDTRRGVLQLKRIDQKELFQ
ncbi:hypothetical protein AVEN_83348-1 [Araneus ventricosus]|uniref:RNase H type-1 domain-containing protein n=1 Tax=Araneus ventricosus TaxID=182803 RepID=A0A4Y2MT57_ARAVE|nr:hypothetical protein AVEN_83348-1 [Araneus ventricosus]